MTIKELIINLLNFKITGQIAYLYYDAVEENLEICLKETSFSKCKNESGSKETEETFF